MAFLAPLFLLGLLAVAVPVLIHLTHRQRREPIAFPSLMFLRRIEFRTTKRQRIRNWLLFTLRVLGLVLLALAFSRPFLRSGEAAAAAAGTGGREVVILLDGSFSMNHGDRWTRAQREARRVVEGLGPSDRATIVRFAARAEALVQPTADRGALRAAIDAARPGAEAGRYAPALALARGVLARAEGPRREVVLVSDLQRAGWAPDEELRLPAGTSFAVADVGDEGAANVAVTDVDLARVPGPDGRVALTATARVASLGGTAPADVPVTLSLGGRELARQSVRVPANGAASVRLGPVALPAGTVPGTVRAGSDLLAGDDVRHFTVDRGRAIRVLLVRDAAASPSRASYLQRALSIAGDPPYEVDLRRGSDLSAADLVGRSVVILDDAAAPRGAAARALVEFVRAGGGLIVTFGERTRPAEWTGDLATVLPAAPGEMIDRMPDRGGRLGAMDRSHPALEPFAEPRSGNFSAPRFFRYRPLAPAEGAAVIARFDDGAVALAGRRTGTGRALAWGSTFDNVWNDLPVQPVFPPLVRQLVRHAAGWAEEPASRTVGDVLDVRALGDGAEAAAAEHVALSPAGERTRIAAGSPALALDAPGVWELRRFGERDSPARLVAVNVDPRESDPTRVPRAEVVAALAPRGAGEGAATMATVLTARERESRQSLWWFLLLGAALLLATETVLSNRLTAARR